MKGNNTITGSNSASQVHADNDIMRYLKLVYKRKWLILITFLVAFFFWMAYTVMFQSQPTYTATALLTFEDPRNLSAVSNDQGSNIGKAQLLKSVSLLTKVINILDLNFSMITQEIGKEQVFKYLDVNEETMPGDYKLIIEGQKYDLRYRNEEEGIDEKQILRFSPSDTVNINRMVFVLNKDIPVKIVEFRVKKFENTMQSLQNNIEYDLDRSKTLLTIRGTFLSPQTAAKIVNTIVDNYLELLLSTQKFKTNEVMKILENEMKLAKIDLEKANDKLKRFREKYPWVGLRPATNEQIDKMSILETSQTSTEQKINELNDLIVKSENAQDVNARIIVSQELLAYLSSENITLVPAFQSQYLELTTKRNSLLGNYAPSHPYVMQNEDELNNLFQKIRESALDHLAKLESQSTQIADDINSETSKIQKLPTKEIELAELVRDKDVKNELYGSILTRYNAAKIQNEVEVSDVSVIDRAVPPPVQSVMGNLVKSAVIGLLLSLAFGVALAFVVEFFNKTVENADELQKRLQLIVIGSIPLIRGENGKAENFQDLKSKREPRLITLDYSPTLESESYRDLRTKILYMNQDRQSSSFLITSLRAGEGKSLTASNIAITFAQQKISTVLIDADIRRGVLHNVFGNKKKPGLSDFIVSNATIDYNNINKLIQSTFVPNLFLVTAGSPVPNPSELVGSERMKDLVNVFKSKFGMVILDTPPFQGGSDSIILSNIVDSLILLVRANFTNVENLEQKIVQYPFLHEKIMGVILNMVKMDNKKEQYQYTYYHY
jgi:capsular exopolysaccharide synthesis family protein